MGVRRIRYAQQADAGVVETVYLVGILRIDTLDGDVHIRLSGAEPHVAHQDVGQTAVVDL